jgi:glyoxylase-like metal-dependent hydrolase (beta-lactamase superfamily II)
MLSITRVLAPNPSVYTLEGTNTWIVGRDPSIVIDPGPADERHLDEVAREAGRVSLVLVTHDHPDHAPGALPFAERVGAPLHAWRLKGAEPIRDGEAFHAGSTTVAAVHAPGHSADHVVFHVPAASAMFTGDVVLGRGTSFIDPPDGDLTRYLRSLERLRELRPRVLYPGHGPVVLQGEAKLREYVEHRAEREAQLVAALTDGPRTIAEVVRDVYADHPIEVHPLAARSVLANLIKLEKEGRVTRSGKGDDARWSVIESRSCARCGRPVRGRGRYCSTCSLILLQEGTGPAPEDAGPTGPQEEEEAGA